MKIPKYWAKGTQTAQGLDGKTSTFTCWQWSDESVEHARRKANSRASELAQRIANGVTLERYPYGVHPLREETLEVVTNDDGQEIAVITRNGYGAQVLNTTKAMFIDIDFPRQRQPQPSLFGRLFGGKTAPTPEEAAVQQVTAWAETHSSLGIRVYRTLAGLRCLITNRLFEPAQSEALNILQELNSDPLYIRLCKAQECFRARLTPKPWRCGAGHPPAPGFPWEDREQEAEYRAWEHEYQQIAHGYITCRLITQLGTSQVHPEVKLILNIHDRIACSTQNLELA